jgi:hypothetical protein
MRSFSINRFFWWFCVYLIRICGLPFHLAAVKIPRHEYSKLKAAADGHDIIIVFNGGGWGDVPLSQTADFKPILNGIWNTLAGSGRSVAMAPYYRTLPGLAGRMAGIREQLTSFKLTCRVQIEDLQSLASGFPHKAFILVGYSVGGGLSGKSLESLAAAPNIYGITVGVPGWFRTFSSNKSLVLNNNNLDPLCTGDVKTIAGSVLLSPITWLRARLKGQKLSLALALKIPHHEYTWDSEAVSGPIIKFLETYFSGNQE